MWCPWPCHLFSIKATKLKHVSARRNFKSDPISMQKLYWRHQLCGCLTWLIMWCHQLSPKKVNPKSEQSPPSLGHCDPCKGAKHPGSGPCPIQSQLGSMWLVLVPPHQRKFDWPGRKPSSQELHELSPSDYQNAPKSWRRRLELCVWSGGEPFEGMWLLYRNRTAASCFIDLRTSLNEQRW